MESGRNNNFGRDGGAGGHGRGRRAGGRVNRKDQGGRERGNSQNQPSQGSGRERDAPRRGSHRQPPSMVNQIPVQANQPAPPQASASQQPHQVGVNPASGRGGAWSGRPWGPPSPPTPPVQPQRPPQPSAGMVCVIFFVVFFYGFSAPQQPHQVGVSPASERAGTCTRSQWGPSPPSTPPVQPPSPPQPSADELEIQTLKISEQQTLSRPDRSGSRRWRDAPQQCSHQQLPTRVNRRLVQGNQLTPLLECGYRPSQTPEQGQLGVGPASERAGGAWCRSAPATPPVQPPHQPHTPPQPGHHLFSKTWRAFCFTLSFEGWPHLFISFSYSLEDRTGDGGNA